MAECKTCGHDLPGGFCHACCRDFPPEIISIDPRYCQKCFEFLSAEAELLSPSKRPAWIPKAAKPSPEALDASETGAEGQYHIPQYVVLNMSTVNSKKSEVDVIIARAAARPLPKRGPKFTSLPEDLIRQWAGEGIGSKAIAARLKGEHDIDVSYKTIQRRLQGVLV